MCDVSYVLATGMGVTNLPIEYWIFHDPSSMKLRVISSLWETERRIEKDRYLRWFRCTLSDYWSR